MTCAGKRAQACAADSARVCTRWNVPLPSVSHLRRLRHAQPRQSRHCSLAQARKCQGAHSNPGAWPAAVHPCLLVRKSCLPNPLASHFNPCYNGCAMPILDCPDTAAWPKLAHVRGLTVPLDPGTLLFLPAYWYASPALLLAEKITHEAAVRAVQRQHNLHLLTTAITRSWDTAIHAGLHGGRCQASLSFLQGMMQP